MTHDAPFTAGAPAAGEPLIEYLYVTVARRILYGIQTTGLQPGQRLPPMEELAAGFNVSRTTVRQAIKLLEQRDLAVRMHGRGTFVGERAAALATAAPGENTEMFDLPALGFAVDPTPPNGAADDH